MAIKAFHKAGLVRAGGNGPELSDIHLT